MNISYTRHVFDPGLCITGIVHAPCAEDKLRKDEMIISWSGIIKEKIQDKSSEYCLGCKDNGCKDDGLVNHRDDCYRGNNLKFVLHHFPIILREVLSIRKFWKCMEPYVEKNPHEEELMTNIEDFLNNFGDKNHTICRKILNNILSL